MTTRHETLRRLPPGAHTLLKTIAEHDDGDGVMFDPAPYGRWTLRGSDYAVNRSTFHTLAVARGFIDVGDGFTNPVRITQAGRDYLDHHQSRTARKDRQQ
ncbi:hypothetical protein FXF51_01730 [Nonomuraea sp. PA05]|uniref:hypothetical protein n=1 Tax=Nonomuraea sp. PA05 TaxID=2604466 RepID=UPI0011D53209|nr:hypothetical protein [Nonomuraea sp. PA05]TYB71182.1 hypothetical protein FXF51_01730 [Nonomuraea sp. PA05]